MTKIPWTQLVCNVFTGCRQVSAGCRHCYAESFAKRLKGIGHPCYQDVVDKDGWTGKVQTNFAQLRKICRMKKRRLVMVESMGDFFYEGITDPLRDEALGLMLQADQHIWQILTKRAQGMRDYYERVREEQAQCGEPSPFPAAHIWHGVTIEDQPCADERIAYLCDSPSFVRFVSAEPLLGPLDLRPAIPPAIQCLFYQKRTTARQRCEGVIDCDRPENSSGKCQPGFCPYGKTFIDWVIIGCEQIHGRPGRFCGPEFYAALRSLLEQCRAAGVPIFVKQIPDRRNHRVLHDPGVMAAYLSEYVMKVTPEEIRQWPAVLTRKTAEDVRKGAQ